MATPAAVPSHLLHVFPTFAVGGAQNNVVRVINALRRKFRHTIVAIDGNFDAASGFDPDLDIALEAVALRKTAFLRFGNLRVARAALRRFRPDLLLTYNWGATEWALADLAPRFCPHIHVESGFGPGESPQRQHWRRILARRVLLSRCQHIVVPSIALRDVATRVWRIPPRRVVYLPNGIDPRPFAAPDPAILTALAIPDGAPVVGTVAALRREKNLARLLRVFAMLPRSEDARLVIVGDGAEQAALMAAAADATIADRVIFTGHMAEPARILGRFDVFALTSDTEQMPISILEAMAARLAVAATDVGDVKRMLSAENAPFVVPAQDEAALAEALRQLLQDRPRARRIGDANRHRVQAEFNLEAMVAGYEALYSGNIA